MNGDLRTVLAVVAWSLLNLPMPIVYLNRLYTLTRQTKHRISFHHGGEHIRNLSTCAATQL